MDESPVLLLNNIRKDCVYECTEDAEAERESRFTYSLTIGDKVFKGTGPSKKEAKASAAHKAMKHSSVNPKYAEYRSKAKQQKKPENANNKQQQSSNAGVVKKQQQQQQQQKQNFEKKNKLNNDSQQMKNMLLKQIKETKAFVYVNGRKICRLYLNSMCMQGSNCPYVHPEYSRSTQPLMPAPQQISTHLPTPQQQVPLGDTFTWLQLCQNYLYHRCPLPNCKFLHVSSEDEEQYVATGRVPSHVVEQAIRKALIDDMAPSGVTQPCKDYFSGQCKWYSCPFRHVSRQEFALEVTDMLQKNFSKMMRPSTEFDMFRSRLSNSPTLPDRSYQQSLYERQQQPWQEQYRRPVHDRLGGEDYLNQFRRPMYGDDGYRVSRMSGLMGDASHDMNQREINKLREELKMLNEENEKLRNSMHLMSLEEENRKLRNQQQHRAPSRSQSYPKKNKNSSSSQKKSLNTVQLMDEKSVSYNFNDLWNVVKNQGLLLPQQQGKGKQQNAKKNSNKQNPSFNVAVKKSGQVTQSSNKTKTAQKKKQNQSKQNQNQERQNQDGQQNKNQSKPQRQKKKKTALGGDQDKAVNKSQIDKKPAETLAEEDDEKPVIDATKESTEDSDVIIEDEEGSGEKNSIENENKHSGDKTEEEEIEREESEKPLDGKKENYIKGENSSGEPVSKTVETDRWVDAVDESSSK